MWSPQQAKSHAGGVAAAAATISVLDKGREGSELWEIPACYLGVLCFSPIYLLVSISRHL